MTRKATTAPELWAAVLAAYNLQSLLARTKTYTQENLHQNPEVYVEGLYRVGASQVYTSRGIGMVHLSFRFNCPPEVTEMTLAQGEPGASNCNNASEVAPQNNEV